MKLKQKSKTKIWFAAFLLVSILALGGTALADQDFRSLLADKLAAQLAPDILQKLDSVDNALGLNVISSSNTGLTNVRIGGQLQQASSETQTYYTVEQYDVEPWPTATTTLMYQNDKSVTSTLDVEFISSGVVSSTFKLYCGTNSTGQVAYDSSTPPNQLLNGTTFSTSTFNQTIASLTSTSTLSVGPNQYGGCFVAAGTAGYANCANTAGCEQVTSTSRGWSAIVRYRWKWFAGISNTQLSE